MRLVGGGLEALEIVDREPRPFDFALLDIAMPGMDGRTGRPAPAPEGCRAQDRLRLAAADRLKSPARSLGAAAFAWAVSAPVCTTS